MRQLFSKDELSALIGAIYDCAVDRDRWPGTLHRVRIALDFANASLSLIAQPSGDMILHVTDGIDPYWLEQAHQYGQDVVEQWGGLQAILAIPVDQPQALSRFRDRSLWAHNRFYREWGRPQGLHDTLSIPLTLDPTMVGSIGFGRHESMGEIGDIEIEAARLLLPHLQRAVAIGRILEFRSLLNATIASALDTLAAGVVLVDADLGIVHANAAAQDMLARGQPIRADRDVLSVGQKPVAAALRAAVRQAADAPDSIGRRGLGVPLANRDAGPALLHVLPLRLGSVLPNVAPRAAAAIFVTPPAKPVPAPLEAFAMLYDLTSAEVKVFDAIAAGHTRAEAASALALKPSTVKTHLAHIFLKTGTHRQADLVALKASLTLPLQA